MVLLPLVLATATQAQAPTTPVPPEGMVYVPAGEFFMGTNESDESDNNQRDNVPLKANDARPRHTARSGAFFIDKTEVTNAQYKKFCDAMGYPAPPMWNDGQFPAGEADFPVTRVNFYEASAYAAWAGKRLPTEIEWEHAARGDDGRNYPWGAYWDENRVVWDTNGPQKVGSIPDGASPYGALDMAGNVFEWTSSWFDAYPGAPVKVPEFGKTLKVVRGGGWTGGRQLAMTWYRGVNRPQSRIEWVGFRCAKDAPATLPNTLGGQPLVIAAR
ncbi:MAG TPA: SUMF1/EgtB/PvdO family nonheme iron enzyme [Abditibacterium sp.]